MINARMVAEKKLVIQEMMVDLRELWYLADNEPGPHRGGISGPGMQTDFLHYGEASDLWDAHASIKRAKVRAQMVVASHRGHEPERWDPEARNSPSSGPAIDEWPKRYR